MENSARFPIDDSPQFVKDLPHKNIIALIAPSAQCNFELPKLITALRILGVTAVYDVSLGAEITVACYHQAISSGKAKTPLIGQSCPAIVKYIEIHHPNLIEHLAPTGSPVHDLAVYVNSLHPHSELAFISPCLAKRREFQDSGMVKYNVLFQSLHEIFESNDIKLADLEDGHFDHIVQAGQAASFSSPGGLKECYLHHYSDIKPSQIAKVEGPIIYEKYFQNLERAIRKNQPDLPLIIDVLSCENGCNMGPGCINHRKAIDYIDSSVHRRAETALADSNNNQLLLDFLNNVLPNHDFSYCQYQDLSHRYNLRIPNEEELKEIYFRMHKTDEKDFRNCAACGYNSCFYMAIAIFNGLNKVENCHLYQEKELRYEHESLNQMVEELEQLNQQLQQEFNERKHQEQLLVQNSKLAAMGEMIGMIAHQWRQPLSSISTLAGNLQVLIDLDAYDREQFKALLNDINAHSQYLSSTINDFRHFFKPDNPRDTVLVSQIVESTLGIIGKSLEYKNVTLVKDYALTNPILTYPNELMQVFLNIIKNASDAFVENDIIEPLIIIKGYEYDDYQLVEIEDNAGGIPDDIMDKIFDPYFSTKGPGIGTGLGLYMSKMIVEQHCLGQLTVKNTEKGACFSIKLPV